MSDWDVDELSMEAFVRDLETVVDAVALASSQTGCGGCRISPIVLS